MVKKLHQLNIKVDKTTKEKAQKVFEELGINLTSAINLFLNQSVIEGGLPFKPSTKLSANNRKQGKNARRIKRNSN